MSTPNSASPRNSSPRLWLLGISFVALAIILATYGIVSRADQNSRLRQETASQAVPTVAIVAPTAEANQTTLELPGRLEAYIRAPIYARVPGYLKSWQHDIGGKVKAGDLLAEIDAPDLDQQLVQARADLNVAQANAKLAQISAERWQSLAGTDAVAKEDVDTRTFTWNANVAQVKASEANVERLVAEEGFKRLVAPFDGVVTARDTDIGALINVGSTGGPELFEVSETSKLRVYVNVPQNFVPDVPPGTKAILTVPEHPGATFGATVEASAQAVNPSTGTTLMQLIVDNSAGEMMPGDYASIHLSIAPLSSVLSVPSSAVVFDSKGLSVATVGADDRVLLKRVSIARDLGAVVELTSGLAPTDRVIENPPDGITDGTLVHRAATAGVSAVASAQGKHEHGKG